MSISAITLNRLAALKLSAKAFREVLSIIAEIEAADDARREKERTRKRLSRGHSADIPRHVRGHSADGHTDNTSQKEISPIPPKEKLLPQDFSIQEEVEKKKEGTGDTHARGTKLPDDWQPTSDDLAYGGKLGLRLCEIESMAEDMRMWAHGNSNRGVARKANWSMTFKGWMRREAKKRGSANNGKPRNRLAGALEQLGRTIEVIEGGRAESGEVAPRLLSRG
jgi:hypothetical protein